MLPVPEYTDYVGLSEMTIREPITKQEKDKAKRLWKAYRWTWAMYWALGVKQGWKCGICGRSAKNSALNGDGMLDGLNLDHAHFRVVATRLGPADQLLRLNVRWKAETTVQGVNITRFAKTQKVAIEAVKNDALPLSVRGLLCPGRHGKAGHGCCNRLLGRVDNVEWLEASAEYLKNPPAKGLQS